MNKMLKTVYLGNEVYQDPDQDPEYDPISYFGKENTQRTKRAHERKPKKVVICTTTVEDVEKEWTSTRQSTRERSKFIVKREKKMIDPFEPVVYHGPTKKKPDGQKLLKFALKDLQD